MDTIAGYHVSAKIYESASSVVYRALRTKDGLPVVLKLLNQDYPGRDQIAKFRQEYGIASALDGLPGVISVYGFEKPADSPAIVMEDFGADSLDKISRIRRFEVREAVRLAIAVTKAIGDIHHARIIHKDINPANIVLCQDTGRLKLIDFGSATSLPRENPAIAPPHFPEGAPAYISPEQTGRGSRSLDYRTDYYSLGATLYELFTGHPPFTVHDPLELLHSHLARKPVAPRDIHPELPIPLSELVLKLLAKDAEDRYQSAAGIVTDLEECLRRLEQYRGHEPFQIAVTDIPERFTLPERLYGREEEIGALRKAYERVCDGGKELFLIAGPSGVGKTALAQEISRRVAVRGGSFARGKFDEIRGAEPYTALVEAFTGLIQRMLTESDARIAACRDRLETGLGAGSQVIAGVIPDLERIMGPQPAVPPVGLVEARNRFVLAFRRFLAALGDAEQPLVLVLDDLHWADRPSLDLLRGVMEDTELRHVLVLATYRDDQVESDHPLFGMEDFLRRAGAAVSRVEIRNLGHNDVAAMMREVFRSDEETCRELAPILHAKTFGSPLALREILTALHAERLVVFDSIAGAWVWDITGIQNHAVVDNVAPLMAEKIDRLEPATQRLLTCAGLLGYRFDLQTLAAVAGRTSKEVLDALWPALSENLIMLLGPAWKSGGLDEQTDPDAEGIELQFAHDRIQQAACNRVSAAERQAIHRAIGRILVDRIPPTERGSNVFAMVSHLNEGLASDDPWPEKLELARLNLLAAEKAKLSAAYVSAQAYARFGITLMGDTGWREHYPLVFELYAHAAESAFLAGDSEEMGRLLHHALGRARTALDRARLAEIQIQADVAANQTEAALENGLKTLRLLGVQLPRRPGAASILATWIVTRTAMVFRPISRLAGATAITNPETLLAMRIMACLASAAYVTRPELVPMIACTLTRISLKQGYAPATAYGCAGLGLFHAGVMADFEGGYQLGNLALTLLERQQSDELKARTIFAVNCFLRHWKQHVADTLPPLLDTYRLGLESGDMECAAVSAFMHSRYAYFAGRDLAGLEEEMREFGEKLQQLPYESPLHAHRMTRQAVLNLMGRSPIPWILDGDAYREEEMLPIHVRDNDARAMLVYHFHKLVLSYLFGRYDESVEHLRQGTPYLRCGQGTHTVCLYNFYGSLALLAAADGGNGRQVRQALRMVKRNQRTMSKWARHAPMNHLHRFHLVHAARCGLAGNSTEAAEHFDRAIQLAREHGYLHEEALANELAGRFFLHRGRRSLAKIHLEQARYGYDFWGAAAKVSHLEEAYDERLVRPSPASSGEFAVRRTASTSTDSGTGQYYDLEALAKASHAISSEIKLPALLKQLVTILMEIAGAERGFVILLTAGELRIEAEALAETGEIVVLQSQPMHVRADLATSVIHYVARTRDTVVLEDAGRESRFMSDPYILAGTAKSILAMPVIHKGVLNGVLYLENNLSRGAFTAQRSEVLSLLCGQAAISLENARLYERVHYYSQTLEKRVSERTAELSSSNEALRREMRERMQAQEALKQSEARFRDLAELLPQCVFELDANGTLTFLNRAGMQLTGYTPENPATGVAAVTMLAASDRERAKKEFARIMAGETVKSREYQFLRSDGATFPVIAYVAPITHQGTATGARGVCVDVSELKSVEEQLRSSLREKETLMREIHHRVKNNLQLVSSLLRLQSRYADQPAVRRGYEDVERRVRSMALVHERLYQSDDLSRLSARDHLRTLADDVLSSHEAVGVKVTLTTDLDNVPLGIDTAIPLGLIFTELMSNCVKHGFRDRRKGHVTVAFKQIDGDQCRLSVHDNGIGVPEDFDVDAQTSMGLRLVSLFSRQIGADLEVRGKDGTEIAVSFSLPTR